MRVVIDTDPGVDDAMALTVAVHSPEIDLLAVTTTHGNVSLELAHRNAVYILDRLGRPDIPVYRGARAPLARAPHGAEEVHGEHGLGYAEGAPRANARPEHAVAALIELARRERFVLMPVGPLTNVALALALDPDAIKAGVERIVLMGGNVQAPGNVTSMSEFNFWADPEAARVVLTSGIPIEMVGLDVTSQVILTGAQVEAFGGANPTPWEEQLKQMMRCYLDFHRKVVDLDGCVVNDPLAVALLVHPEWGKAYAFPMSVDCSVGGPTQGQVIADRRPIPEGVPNCKAYLEVDAEAALAWVQERMRG